jgi:hypothetical protein
VRPAEIRHPVQFRLSSTGPSRQMQMPLPSTQQLPQTPIRIHVPLQR